MFGAYAAVLAGTQCLSEPGRVTWRRLQGEPRRWSPLQLMSLYDIVALFQAKNTPAIGAARGGQCMQPPWRDALCCGTSQGQPTGEAGVALPVAMGLAVGLALPAPQAARHRDHLFSPPAPR